jgi:hypothetical protein
MVLPTQSSYFVSSENAPPYFEGSEGWSDASY